VIMQSPLHDMIHISSHSSHVDDVMEDGDGVKDQESSDEGDVVVSSSSSSSDIPPYLVKLKELMRREDGTMKKSNNHHHPVYHILNTFFLDHIIPPLLPIHSPHHHIPISTLFSHPYQVVNYDFMMVK